MPELLPRGEQFRTPKKIELNVYQIKKPIKKSKLLWISLASLIMVIVLIGLGFMAKIITAINSTNADSGEKISFFEQISHLIVNPDKKLKGENSDRINILLAGIGGDGHEGAYLADTIILVSLKPSTNEAATISIPRDLYTEIPGYGWRKINNALAFGRESDYPGGGEALLTDVVSKITGLTIHYYARIDFAGFKKIIDDLNGIDIYIDNSFDDYEYPDYNYGIQHISFKKGLEHMNGERALQFVRSRHGTNGEGSDFARSKRQQKVLLALKEKIFSVRTITSPSAIISVLDDLGNHNQTNFQIWELVKLATLIQNVDSSSLISRVLDNSPEGLLKTETTQDGAYILTPKSGDFSEIQYLAANIFNTTFIARENANIEVQNSTSTAGLATRLSERLKSMDYNVTKVGNAQGVEPLTKTTIYDLSGGKNPYTLVSLKKMLNADISSVLPAYMTRANITYESISQIQNSNIDTANANTDILVIIGADQTTTSQLSSSARATIKNNL